MDRQRYISEGYRQHNDSLVHLRNYATTINDIDKDIQRLADQLYKDEVITDDTRESAIREDAKPDCLLQKLHNKVYRVA